MGRNDEADLLGLRRENDSAVQNNINTYFCHDVFISYSSFYFL